MKRYAIIIATDEYQNGITPTPFCHNDAKLLKDTLIGYCDYAEQDILLELLKPNDEIEPIDILKKIQGLTSQTQDGDTILFFYAGHGHLGKQDGEAYIILPSTNINNLTQTALPLRDISEKMRRNSRIMIRIFDTCHSGLDVRNFKTTINQEGFARSVLTQAEEGWVTLAACKYDESSHPDTNLQQGIFTYSLCESIREMKENEKVLPELIKIEVCKKVEKWCGENNRQQTPTLNSSISGNISFATRKKNIVKPEQVINDINKESNLIERFHNIRSGVMTSNESYDICLQSHINLIFKELNGSLSAIEKYDSSLTLEGPKEAEYLPEDLTDFLVPELQAKHYDARHEFKTETKKKKRDMLSAYLGRFYEPEYYTKNYIKQNGLNKKCFVYVNLKSDLNIIPEAYLGFYVLPLQIKVCLISVILYKSHNRNPSKWDGKLIEKIIELENNENNEIIKQFVLDGIESFNKEISQDINKRITYLEWENELS